jgi:uncharacterized protein (TIGR00730 family)
MSEKIITIFGSGSAKPGDAVFSLAEEIGRLLAGAGFTIANGGYGGTMLAVAKGAAEAGGKTIGVTCSAFKGSVANEYISRQIVTASLDERLDTLIKLGRGYIVLAGGTGTLLELAKIWELKNKGFMRRGKPIIIAGEFWKPLVDLIATDDPGSSRYIEVAAGPDEVKDILLGSDFENYNA